MQHPARREGGDATTSRIRGTREAEWEANQNVNRGHTAEMRDNGVGRKRNNQPWAGDAMEGARADKNKMQQEVEVEGRASWLARVRAVVVAVVRAVAMLVAMAVAMAVDTLVAVMVMAAATSRNNGVGGSDKDNGGNSNSGGITTIIKKGPGRHNWLTAMETETEQQWKG
jgi:hypothetical protein